MHEHGVIHRYELSELDVRLLNHKPHLSISRDACYFNFMVDSSKLVPDDDISFFHPSKTADWSRSIKTTERRSVSPLKYYLIDFETSMQYPLDEKTPLCLGRFGQEHEAPEMSKTEHITLSSWTYIEWESFLYTCSRSVCMI